RSLRDWSSDVCSSDLCGRTSRSGALSLRLASAVEALQRRLEIAFGIDQEVGGDDHFVVLGETVLDLDPAVAAPSKLHCTRFKARSEERRVGKEGRARW